MTTMIERVVAANKRAWDEWPEPITTANLAQVREAAAKACIAAMREPAEEMVSAMMAVVVGTDTESDDDGGYATEYNAYLGSDEAMEVFSSAIDAALGEKP